MFPRLTKGLLTFTDVLQVYFAFNFFHYTQNTVELCRILSQSIAFYGNQQDFKHFAKVFPSPFYPSFYNITNSPQEFTLSFKHTDGSWRSRFSRQRKQTIAKILNSETCLIYSQKSMTQRREWTRSEKQHRAGSYSLGSAIVKSLASF